MTASAKAVFLDRDGVLNEALVRDGKPFSPMTIAEVVVPPDVPGALSRLRQNGFRLIMVTNQPNIARGSQSRETVHAINRYLRETLQLQAAGDLRTRRCRQLRLPQAEAWNVAACGRSRSHSTDGKFYDRRPLARH